MKKKKSWLHFREYIPNCKVTWPDLSLRSHTLSVGNDSCLSDNFRHPPIASLKIRNVHSHCKVQNWPKLSVTETPYSLGNRRSSPAAKLENFGRRVLLKSKGSQRIQGYATGDELAKRIKFEELEFQVTWHCFPSNSHQRQTALVSKLKAFYSKLGYANDSIHLINLALV